MSSVLLVSQKFIVIYILNKGINISSYSISLVPVTEVYQGLGNNSFQNNHLYNSSKLNRYQVSTLKLCVDFREYNVYFGERYCLVASSEEFLCHQFDDVIKAAACIMLHISLPMYVYYLILKMHYETISSSMLW